MHEEPIAGADHGALVEASPRDLVLRSVACEAQPVLTLSRADDGAGKAPGSVSETDPHRSTLKLMCSESPERTAAAEAAERERRLAQARPLANTAGA